MLDKFRKFRSTNLKILMPHRAQKIMAQDSNISSPNLIDTTSNYIYAYLQKDYTTYTLDNEVVVIHNVVFYEVIVGVVILFIL